MRLKKPKNIGELGFKPNMNQIKSLRRYVGRCFDSLPPLAIAHPFFLNLISI